MKKATITLTNLIIITFLFAQPPEKMSYKAIIRDYGNNLVTNQSVGIKVSILKGTPGGMAVYVETQTALTNDIGLLSIEIGSGTPVTGNFSTIDWSKGPYFIKTETDTKGGTDYSITGISQILSVPFALNAKSAESITGNVNETDPVFGTWNKNYDNLTNKPDLSVFVTRNMAHQNITNLAKPVNARDASTKAYVDEYIHQLYEQGTLKKVKDADGNFYNVVKIGSQIWMKENLKTTKFNNGVSIPLVTVNKEWASLVTPGYCWYNNSRSAYGNTYGALYNWYTVNTGILCPVGWHVPHYSEWYTLIYFLGDEYTAGGKMKETGSDHWEWPNYDATNSSGFTGLPGGYRDEGGTFKYVREDGDWWSSDEDDGEPWLLNLWWYDGFATMYYSTMRCGFSIRCLKD